MRTILLLFVTTYLVSCSGNTKQQVLKKGSDTLIIKNTVYNLDSINENAFRSIKTVALNEPEKEIITDTNVIRKDTLLLVFKLRNGKEKTLKNDTTDENFSVYKFIESFANIDYWFVGITYYEGSGYLLIDKETGDEINVWGKPYFSDNNKFFFTYSFDIEATFDPNGIQFFKVDNRKVKNIWSKELLDWGPSGMKWSGDSSVVIEQSRLNNAGNNADSYLLSFRRMKIIK
jgi:hypothetical protein